MTSDTASTSSTGAGTRLRAEIEQQPDAWRQVARAVVARREGLDAFLGPLLARAETRVVLVGAGTSAFAGQVAAPALSRALHRRVEAVATTDLVSDPCSILTPDVPTLLVSFARSGDSPESVAATELADHLLGHAAHLVLTCNPDGRLAQTHRERASSLVLLMPAQVDDQSFAMTSSFTTMTLAAMLALDKDVDALARADGLARAAEHVLAFEDEITALAELRPPRVVYLGSGSLTGLARESALKLTELTAGEVVALGESSLGFRHGPKAVLTADTLAVVYLSNDPYTRRYDLDILAELVHQLGPRRVVAVDRSSAGQAGAQQVLAVPGGAELDAYWALPAALVAQLLGLRTSLLRGHAPDNPFPTGEVNRVVQGVTVYPLTS